MKENPFAFIPMVIRILVLATKTLLSEPQLSCGTPPPVRNAILQYSSTTTGATVTYKCRDGFSINGPKSRTCLENGKWNNMAPRCFPLCSRPALPHMAFIKFPQKTNVFATGKTITLGCEKGFKQVGFPSSFMCFSGKWVKFRPFSCQANHSCPRLMKRAKSSCTSECSPYIGCSTPETHDCLCDGKCGFSCVKRDLNCGVPSPLANGKRKFSGTRFNSTVRYTCSKRHNLRGPVVRRCTGKGKWSEYEPTCEKFCNKPDVPVNSQPVKPKRKYLFGEKARFVCMAGYYSERLIIKQCRAGLWIFDSALRCKPGGCGDHWAPSNGSVYTFGHGFNSTAWFACDMGYTLRGSKERKCLLSGQWSGITPSCHIIDCGLPQRPKHGKMIIYGTTFQKGARVLCHTGYKLAGPAERFCLLDGKWSGTDTNCLPVDCGPLESLTNGIVVGNKTTFPNKVTFVCHKNFILVGSRERVCQSNGTWSRTNVDVICKRANSSEKAAILSFDYPAPREESSRFSGTLGMFGCFFFVAFLVVILITMLVLFPRRQKLSSEFRTSTPLLIVYRHRSCSV